MLRKRFWIPIVCIFVIAMGCGLFYGRKVADQEPVKVYKPVDFQHPVAPKPPPPGESYETGHWHGDEWHSEPHEAHTPAAVSEVEAELPTPPAERTEVQSAPVVAPPIDAQIIEQAAQDGKVELFSERTQEYYEAVEKWQEWGDKHSELTDEYSQVNHAFDDLLPTEEEAIRFENDENYKRELGRNITEAAKKIAEVERKMQEHEEKRPPFPYIQ
ncbi:hypothetical protein F4X88_00825 [Candidatus Poribacteria bacterium]|nr:hypothetical protein [Candidatus Poribacteria bacterium]MYA54813.1 hypothetical protein [Candidatus Poribacteria bacterium]